MKSLLTALLAVLIGLTFADSSFADAGKSMSAPAKTAMTGGEMKMEGGQNSAKSVKKHERKKHREEKKEGKK